METQIKSSLSDTPFDEDLNDFGTERYVNGLIKFIENSSTPITIALQGEWGSGKTSLMTRLERALCGSEKDFIGIKINTWEYSMLSSAEETVLKIVERLVRELSSGDSISRTKFQNFLRGPLFRGAREAAKMIPGLNIAIEAANVPTNLDKGDEPEQEPQTLSDLKLSLEDGVKKIKGETKKGVIVFVDDLDRLNPSVAVEILELLKNIFCIRDCIFVLAIDYEVVVKGLEPKFGKLNDKNEREFRSFFDKIIQVPFSLPVNNYRPMDFVMKSLVNIGYISDSEKRDDRFRDPIQQIVEKSVGKNPRSIKRLINTLSLLSCIAGSGKDDDETFVKSPNGRIANFAIVALQVCYPKIYRMLSTVSNFEEWDKIIAIKMAIPFHQKDGEASNWEDILYAACSTDKYLETHFNDIRDILLFIQSIVDTDELKKDNKSFGERIKSLTDKSSVTGVSEPIHSADIDFKQMISRLHGNVDNYIRNARPDITYIQPKKNTGNGGFFLGLPNGGNVEVIIRPKVLCDKVSCLIILSTQINRPDYLMGKNATEVFSHPKVANMISEFDKIVSPLLEKAPYFEGHVYPETGMGTYFKSFHDEQYYRSRQGWHPVHITQTVEYTINLANEIMFEDKAIVKDIANIIIANYDLRVAAENL